MLLVQKWPFLQLLFLGNIGKENVFYDILERKNVFLADKNKKFKKSNNLHFSKGVNPWFSPKNGHFFNFFFKEIKGKKMCFTIIWNEKTPFQAIKRRSFKHSTIDIFTKGLTHGFGRKMAIFQTFCFRQCRPGKCLLRYSRTKKRLSRLEKQENQKVEKFTFFQRA